MDVVIHMAGITLWLLEIRSGLSVVADRLRRVFDPELAETPGPEALVMLAAVDPAALDGFEVVEWLRAWDRMESYAAARRTEAARVVFERARDVSAGRDPRSADVFCHDGQLLSERAGTTEVAWALRISRPAALDLVRDSQRLAHLPATKDLYLRGVITRRHVRRVLNAVQGVEDVALLAAVEDRGLRRAATQNPTQLGTSMARAVLREDHDAAARRMIAALERRGVSRLASVEGIGGLEIRMTDADTAWAFTVIDALAKAKKDQIRAALKDDAGLTAAQRTAALPSLDVLRAEVVLDLIAKAAADPAFPTEHGQAQTRLNVVVDLPTVLGLANNPAEVNGEPVPRRPRVGARRHRRTGPRPAPAGHRPRHRAPPRLRTHLPPVSSADPVPAHTEPDLPRTPLPAPRHRLRARPRRPLAPRAHVRHQPRTPLQDRPPAQDHRPHPPHRITTRRLHPLDQPPRRHLRRPTPTRPARTRPTTSEPPEPEPPRVSEGPCPF